MLTDAELDRYARQIILPAFGGAGQAKLKAAHVAVIGAGGIGCPAITYLAAAGQPIPPAPISATCASFSFAWPAPPNCGTMIWRA